MFKRILLGATAFAVLAGTASAADLPSRRAPAVFAPPPPVFTWTGFYIGVNAGYAFQADRTHTLSGNDSVTAGAVAANTAASYVQNRTDGFTGGGQIGYNYEFGAGALGDRTGGVVVGVEADAAYTDLGSAQQSLSASGITATQTSDRQDYLGTVRGRAGVAFGSLLVYGTGGFAYGSVQDSTRFRSTGLGSQPAGTIGFAGSATSTRTGYAAGGGIEYALPTASFLNVLNAGAITVKAEYLHYDLGTTSYRVSGTGVANTGGTSFTDRVRTSGNLVRAGINYKLDVFAPAAPVVARY